jgi:hypothetical protein
MALGGGLSFNRGTSVCVIAENSMVVQHATCADSKNCPAAQQV